MNKYFVPHEESIELKVLGFDEPCILLYRGEDTQPVCQMGYEFKTEKNSDFPDKEHYWLKVPLYQQAFEWFRTEFSIDSHIRPNISVGVPKTYQFVIDDETDDEWYDSYEEAELACLKTILEILKHNTK